MIPPYLHEELVSGIMTKGIIDEFKIVYINQHECARLPCTSCARGFNFQLDVKKSFIVKTRKFIGQEQGFQCIVFPFKRLDSLAKLVFRFVYQSFHLLYLIITISHLIIIIEY